MICFRCGKQGHISTDCPEPPPTKRQRPTDDGFVVCTMPTDPDTLAQFQQARRRLWPDHFKHENPTTQPLCQSCNDSPDDNHDNDDDANVIDHPGCAILDSGATCGVSSLVAADVIQQQRLRYNEEGESRLVKSDRRFPFGDGSIDEATRAVSQPITAGIPQGENVDFVSTFINSHTLESQWLRIIYYYSILSRITVYRINMYTGHACCCCCISPTRPLGGCR